MRWPFGIRREPASFLRRLDTTADPSTLDPATRALVESGPDCICGHPRGNHVTLGSYDAPCRIEGCTGCAKSGYEPGDGRSYADVHPIDFRATGMP